MTDDNTIWTATELPSGGLSLTDKNKHSISDNSVKFWLETAQAFQKTIDMISEMCDELGIAKKERKSPQKPYNPYGSLFVLDGPDGVGKTSILKHIYATYPEPIAQFNEPGYVGDVSSLINKMLRSKENELTYQTLLTKFFLFLANRSEIFACIDKVLGDESKIDIFCDRSSPSTWVYQIQQLHELKSIFASEPARQNFFKKLDNLARLNIPTDMNFIILGTLELQQKSIESRGEKWDERHAENINRLYRTFCKNNSETVTILFNDGSEGEIERIANEIMTIALSIRKSKNVIE